MLRIPWIFKAIKYLAIVLFSLILVWCGLALNSRYLQYRKCVVLPNGLLVGHAAMFDLKQDYWEPNIILMLPDETVLIPENVGLI